MGRKDAVEKLAIALFAASQGFMDADETEIQREWEEYIPSVKEMHRADAMEILDSVDYFKLLAVYEAAKQYVDLPIDGNGVEALRRLRGAVKEESK